MEHNHNSRIFTNDNCTGCNRCISACTVPEANYAVMEDGINKIYVDADKCINCAKCIDVCPHNARDFSDDTDRFLNNLSSGNISVVAAPAIRTNFPQFERLLGTLRKLGAKAIYDTSFGADICTWGYIRYIQKSGATGLISQPCPAIVNYIEKHDPGLISSLAPIQSPAMCTAIYMRKYKNISDEIAFLSPCIAKKDEFDDGNTYNAFQYNVTFKKLDKALKARGIDYEKADADHFDNDQHGMGSIYPMPGGLKVNVHNVIPDAFVYQVEGQPEVRHFLDEYGQVPANQKPFLVDILNCAKGCNIGTGALNSTENDLSVNRIMYDTRRAAVTEKGRGRRKKEVCAGKSLEEFDKILKLDDFVRKYTSKYVKPIPVTQSQVESAYQSLYKTTAEERKIDCSSCGYSSCEEMATAIAKGLNHVENCVEYHRSVLREQQKEIEDMLASREASSRELQNNVQSIFDSLSASSEQTGDTVRQATQIDTEVDELRDIAHKLNDMVDSLSSHINRYVTLSSGIVNISLQTKLLSMNASVEAAHAGEIGKGFAVVAGEMKSLSDQSSKSANEIIASNELILPMLEEVRSFAETLGTRTMAISDSTESILSAVQRISDTEQQATEAASRIISAE